MKFVICLLALVLTLNLSAQPMRQINPQREGARGAALASRSGYQCGISVAEMVAGLTFALIVTGIALVLTNNSSQHAH